MIDVLEVLQRSGLPPTQRLVAVALASRRNPEDGRCDPSLKTLVEDTGLCERTVRLSLRSLEASGCLTSRPSPFSREGTRQYNLKFMAAGSGASPAGQRGGARPAGGRGHLLPGEAADTGAPDAGGGTSRRGGGGHLPPDRGAADAPERKGKENTSQQELPALGKPAGEEAFGGKVFQPKPAVAATAADPRHREITSRIGDRHQAATGQPLPLTGRDVKALRTFLTAWRGTAEEFLTTAERAWMRGRRDPFARNCLEGSSLAGLCARWPQIQGELARKPGTAGFKPTAAAAVASSSPDLARFGIRRGAV
ncbi:MAG: hypothetical protein JWM59_2197 [Verrucomicrobiales bacterium]|nr:hypothetical protein [Verrucomicrobiales bacterium]